MASVGTPETNPDKVDLRSQTPAETLAWVTELGWPRFRAEQIWRWTHSHGARDFAEMSVSP